MKQVVGSRLLLTLVTLSQVALSQAAYATPVLHPSSMNAGNSGETDEATLLGSQDTAPGSQVLQKKQVILKTDKPVIVQIVVQKPDQVKTQVVNKKSVPAKRVKNTRTVRPVRRQMVAQKRPVVRANAIQHPVAVVRQPVRNNQARVNPYYLPYAPRYAAPIKKANTLVVVNNPNSGATSNSNTNAGNTGVPDDGVNAVKTKTQPINTNTASATQTTPAASDAPLWNFRYRSYNSMPLAGLEHAGNAGAYDGEVVAWDRVNVNYNLTKDISISLMPEFFHTWFGSPNRPQDTSIPDLNQPGAFYMGDTSLSILDSKIATFQGGLTLDGFARYYFPTSEMAQDAGSLGSSRFNVGLAKSVGIFDFKWQEDIRYYYQQYQTNALNKVSSTGALTPIQNWQYKIYSLLDIGVNITKKLSFTLETGFFNWRRYQDDADGLNAQTGDAAVLNPDLTYSFTKNFSLSLGIYEEGSIDGGTPYSPFDPINNNEIYMMGTIKL